MVSKSFRYSKKVDVTEANDRQKFFVFKKAEYISVQSRSWLGKTFEFLPKISLHALFCRKITSPKAYLQRLVPVI